MVYFLAQGSNKDLYCNFTFMGSLLPDALLNSLQKEASFDLHSFIGVHQRAESLTSTRINPEKSRIAFDQVSPVQWSKQGVYLHERPMFTADPLFHAGCYYVQEASSMFLEQALSQTTALTSSLKVLDLCAAPGGKSTLISSLITKESLLVSNEIIKSRVPVLCENLTKWGKSNTYVSNNDPKDFGRLEGYFDVVVVDAPCSGSGMFRKDPDAIKEWSEENVNLCSQRQQRILAEAYPALKLDGVLIYSTCSYSVAENEAIADWLTQTFELESIRLSIDPAWGIVETQSEQDGNWAYRFYPNRLRGEGFFLTCFRKKEGNAHAEMKIRKQDPIRIPRHHLAELEQWANTGSLSIRPFQDGYLAVPAGHEQDLSYLQEHLYLKKAGVRLGKFAGKDFIPDHELALSLEASPSIQNIQLNRAQAIAYLKKEDLVLETNKEGWVLMCYEGYGLGWAKVLPKRINNYYPKEWRIVNQQIV